VATKRASSKLAVCILSPHPLVLSEFEPVLSKAQFKVVVKQLESTLAPDMRSFEPPVAQVLVIDGHAVWLLPGNDLLRLSCSCTLKRGSVKKL
jgi:hypothetical protein